MVNTTPSRQGGVPERDRSRAREIPRPLAQSELRKKAAALIAVIPVTRTTAIRHAGAGGEPSPAARAAASASRRRRPPSQLTAAANVVIAAAIPAVIVRGLLRLLREHGVTNPSGGRRAGDLPRGRPPVRVDHRLRHHVDSTLYFAQHTNGTEGDRLHFSFTVLTTTGFGDLSAATPVGHALTVIEELTGQLYLVTVIGY
jgi:hypothetical protein